MIYGTAQHYNSTSKSHETIEQPRKNFVNSLYVDFGESFCTICLWSALYPSGPHIDSITRVHLHYIEQQCDVPSYPHCTSAADEPNKAVVRCQISLLSTLSVSDKVSPGLMWDSRCQICYQPKSSIWKNLSWRKIPRH